MPLLPPLLRRPVTSAVRAPTQLCRRRRARTLPWLRRLRQLPVWALLVSPLLLWAGPASALDDARALLERMSQALVQVQFDGTLVYLHGQDLAALRVSHRINNGTPGESLLSLTGPVRALSRHAEGVTCMLPDAAPLSVSKGHGHSALLPTLPLDFSKLSRHYRIVHMGRFRIAGRETEVVGVRARDGYRYGYRFYVDAASGLPLKIDLLDTDGRPVQQTMFTDIDIEPGPVAETAQAASQQAGAVKSAALSRSASGAQATEATGPAPARTEPAAASLRLPPGFDIVSRKVLSRDDGGRIEQWVASDGLASFSVYIEPPMDGALQGPSQLGAVSAVGGLVGDQQVTVVGEVPLATAHRVLEQMERRGSP